MATSKSFLRWLSHPVRSLRIGIKRRLGWLGVPKIVPYTAYGDRHKIFITGAVVEDKGIARPGEDQPVWRNFLTMIKRYSGDEMPGMRVRIEFGDYTEVVRTNELGIFHTVLPNGRNAKNRESWERVHLTLLDGSGEEAAEADREVQIADDHADFLVVSDVDDTVMISHSTRTFRKLRLMLWKNARSRSPFEGVAEFYTALQEGPGGRKRSIFYVSGSEWNLYDLLVDFFEFKGIPRGTFLLSDAKLKLFSLFRSGKKFQDKIQRIKELFELYYDKEFVLIGDSGQKDPEIYLRIAEMFPSRVRAIYIRNIGSGSSTRREEMLARVAGSLEVEMVWVRSTTEAARHAETRGWIRKTQVSQVSDEAHRESVQED